MPATEPQKTAIESVVLVGAGGLIGVEERLKRTIDNSLLVGVDGGAADLQKLGLRPQIVTGDFDSLSPADLQQFAETGIRIVPTPDQNYTDLDKALDFVLSEYTPKTIHIFGASGGRLDHTYAALSAILKYGNRADLRLVDPVGMTFPIVAPTTIVAKDDSLIGRTLSLLTLSMVEGIHLSGVRWQLNGEMLAPGVRDGTSNQIIAETVTVSAEQGNLLMMVHHAMENPS